MLIPARGRILTPHGEVILPRGTAEVRVGTVGPDGVVFQSCRVRETTLPFRPVKVLAGPYVFVVERAEAEALGDRVTLLAGYMRNAGRALRRAEEAGALGLLIPFDGTTIPDALWEESTENREIAVRAALASNRGTPTNPAFLRLCLGLGIVDGSRVTGEVEVEVSGVEIMPDFVDGTVEIVENFQRRLREGLVLPKPPA